MLNSDAFEEESLQSLDLKPLLTIRQVSELLQVHPNTIRVWSNDGKIPVIRLPGRGDRRFRVSDVEEMMKVVGIGNKGIEKKE